MDRTTLVMAYSLRLVMAYSLHLVMAYSLRLVIAQQLFRSNNSRHGLQPSSRYGLKPSSRHGLTDLSRLDQPCLCRFLSDPRGRPFAQSSSDLCPSPLGRSGLWRCLPYPTWGPSSFAFLKATTITVDRFIVAFYRFRFLQ